MEWNFSFWVFEIVWSNP